MTPTVSSGNRYTISIENKFIITEFLPCVSQFSDQAKVLCMNMYLSHLIRGKLCVYEIGLMYTFGIIAFKLICIFSFFYEMTIMWKPGSGQHFFITANSL